MCFISYCWSNSLDAQKKGTICPPGALGFVDPRDIKKYLEQHGISCWLDIEQAATVSMHLPSNSSVENLLLLFLNFSYGWMDGWKLWMDGWMGSGWSLRWTGECRCIDRNGIRENKRKIIRVLISFCFCQTILLSKDSNPLCVIIFAYFCPVIFYYNTRELAYSAILLKECVSLEFSLPAYQMR